MKLYFIILLKIMSIVHCFDYKDYCNPNCGNRSVIVHLFEWKWNDIASECERFLGPKGFCGVQISPPNEHMVERPYMPWSERYAPVSYKLDRSRSGSKVELQNMITRCKNVGVRIYADAVFNHMAGATFKGYGSSGSYFDASKYNYTGVPYSTFDFNTGSRCPNPDHVIHNYDNKIDVKNCNLGGLNDLNQGKEYVREKIAGYLNSLIEMGVAGFRVDAAKHMWVADLKNIYNRLHSVDGKKPFMFHEVVPGGAVKRSDYFSIGRVVEFGFGDSVREGINDFFKLRGVIHLDLGMAPSDHALAFIDNHDTQRHGQLSYKSPAEYKRAQAFSIAFNYGVPRVMSSYFFDNDRQPPPHDGDVTKNVTINADGFCGNGWVCEHRWKVIGNMVKFRNDVLETGIENWKVDADVVSFSRGNEGFFIMGKNNFSRTVFTNLPNGIFCDLVSECAMKVTVNKYGMADIHPHNAADPFVAITTKGYDGVSITMPPVKQATFKPPTASNYKRTIVLIECKTNRGQDVFIRGGIDPKHRPGCASVANSSCSIPIGHRGEGSSTHFDKVYSWNVGDKYLDWYGAEPGQGSYGGVKAQGSPTFWTTNQKGQEGYNAFNSFGPHYWMFDVNMDCSWTENGYFEFKALLNMKWEGNIGGRKCLGDVNTPPYTSDNHWAVCGKLNVFHFGTFNCQTKDLK